MPEPADGVHARLTGPLVEIDDPGDPRIAAYRDLNDPARRARPDADGSVFVVEGKLAVARLLASRYEIRSLLVDDHQVTAAADLVAGVRARGAPVYVGTRPLVAATVGFALHRGVVAAADRPPPLEVASLLADLGGRTSAQALPPVVAVLEGLNDHENIGALFRNAAAFGVSAVLLDPTCADPLYRRSVRVSMGHLLHVPFARLVPWPDGIDRLRHAGFTVAALAPHPGPGTTTAHLAALRDLRNGGAPVALVLGAEGPGLSAEALDRADLVVGIPMAAGVDSLNVATAAAVAFHVLAGE